MLCVNCANKSICNIYDLKLRQIGSIEIEIKSCKFYRNEYIECSALHKSKDIVHASNKRSENDFTELSNAARQEKQDLIAAICPTCSDVVDKLYSCRVCDKQVCDSCAFFDVESQRHYCEECWGI